MTSLRTPGRADSLTQATAVTVVDDEPAALDVLVRAARSWRFQCQAATTAEQALLLLEQQLTPVVVTDLRMPGRGGVWLVREIQRRWPEVSVIVITAGQDSDAVSECLSAGAHHYFLKPINLDEFRHALEATSRDYRLGQQREHYRRHLERTVQRRTRQLRHTFLSAINSLVRTLEARHPSTCGHSLRVRRYAGRLAEALGWSPRERKQLSLAAKLHDIGKVGLPEGILNKPDVLTAAEWEAMRQHPVIGERILTPILHSRSVLAAIRGHHERWDGTGYPDGLAGEAIPLLARVIAVADCFDALTSTRSYRAPLPRAEALELLRAGSGTQFDPTLVPPFLALLTERSA
ncbi:MAG: response regulator [Gemmataceae bacterium]|nr:response regulator [Gemmataceae bacterium]